MATALRDAGRGSRIVRLLPRDNLIVLLAPEGIYTREKGRRTVYGPISYGRLHVQLAREKADATVKARKAARRGRSR